MVTVVLKGQVYTAHKNGQIHFLKGQFQDRFRAETGIRVHLCACEGGITFKIAKKIHFKSDGCAYREKCNG